MKLLGCYEEVSVFAGAATVLGLLRPVFFVRGLRTGFPPRLPAVASSGGTAAESCGEGGGGGAGGGNAGGAGGGDSGGAGGDGGGLGGEGRVGGAFGQSMYSAARVQRGGLEFGSRMQSLKPARRRKMSEK